MNNLGQRTAVNTTQPAYDADGNQLTGLTATASLPDRNTLTFSWNADNRPVEIKQNGEPKELRTYDHMGRRIRKGDTLTLYDDYNAIAEYNLNTRTLKTTYAWGNDLSGTPQGAGGAGGLLSVTEHNKQTPLVSYPCYDGNGNITEYLTEENGGTLAAHYQYDAFGNVTKKTGEREYNYQFSTKPYDTLTGLNYYNYRDYDPVSGRWINRDPLEEWGGVNLYCFVKNYSVNSIDKLGLCWSNADALGHYISKGGDVDLSATGCEPTVKASIQKEWNEWKEKARTAAIEKMNSIKEENKVEEIFNDDFVGANSGVFWIGGISLGRSYVCQVTCKTYACGLGFTMNDRFEKPTDFDNSDGFFDQIEFGFPFYVSHTWNDPSVYGNK